MRFKQWRYMDEAGGEGGDLGGGADTVAAGNDTVTGNDTLSGDDSLKGGQDTLAGDDTVKSGDDTLGGGADTVAGSWPDDWREKASAGDEKKLKRLERYASPQAALDALLSAQDRIRSGELKEPLKADATEAEIKAWRADNGIPETPDGYDLTLSDGLVIGEADKPIVGDFLKAAHSKNMTPEHVKSTLDWYYGELQRQEDQQSSADNKYKEDGEESLREEYGQDYRRNISHAYAFLDQAPAGIKEQITGARGANGLPLMANPDVMRWLVNTAREINPIHSVVPGSGDNAVQAIETEMANLKKMMGDHESAYWKGPSAKQNQARYKELVEWQQKNQK